MFAKKSLVAFLIAALLSACTDPAPEPLQENKDLEKQVYGEWYSVALRLTMNSYNNQPGEKKFEVMPGEWEEKMNIRPISTFYKEDGTYNVAHYNFQDSLIYAPAGRWKIIGDTIILRDTFPVPGLTYHYKVTINVDELEFRGIEDSDGDGQADDNYFGVQRRKK